VSTSLGHILTDSTKERSDHTDRREGLVASSPVPNTETARRHEVGFYFDDELLVDQVAQFIGDALRSGNAAIVLATAWHRDSIVAKLQAQRFDLGSAIERGRYIALDAAEAISMIMSDGRPDPVRFFQLIGVFIATAAETTKAAGGEHARVAIFGECVHLLWAQGNAEAAIQFEKLGNQLLSTYDIDILCAYSLGGVEGGMDDHVFQRVCAEHSAVHRRELGC
jgi:DcmR-like sensory protein